MSAANAKDHLCLRICCAALGIAAGSIIIGISASYGAAAIGGVFLGAAGLALFITIFPTLKDWFDFYKEHPFLGAPRIHPQPVTANVNAPAAAIRGEGFQNLEKSLISSPTGFPDKQKPENISSDEGPSSGIPDLIAKNPYPLPAPS
ncbi:kinocilin [Ambystoma mexicanum]|uniref:kinocilin n=1 Tax=Ambystoma mexicanum TaxID=8296 RepID=UPI0037E7419A